MEKEELKSRIKNNVRESIAIANMKEEIEINRIKSKKILYSVLSSCAIFIICSVIFLNKKDFGNKLAIFDNNILIQNELTNNIFKESKDNTMEENYQNNIHDGGTIGNDEDTEKENQLIENSQEKTEINEKENLKTENNSTKTEEKKSLSIAKILKEIDKDKIKYVSSAFSFAYKPTIENLYKNSDIVIIGTFDSNLKTYTLGINIRTETKFKTLKVLKNNTNLDINDTVIFNRPGGVMTLSEYMENNDTIRENEFNDISVKERSNYYIIQEFAPDNKLDFSSLKTNNDKYILFLNYREGELSTNSAYYGIREINNDNKIYDYDSKEYINSKLIIE